MFKFIKRIQARRNSKKYQERIKRKPESMKMADSWNYKGTKERFKEVYITELNNQPIKHLASLDIKNPNVMILGAGLGEDIPELKKELIKININPNIDVFSLTKTLPKDLIKTMQVRNDFSNKIGFEEINPKNPKLKKLIKDTKGQYDLVMAPMSVGVHTNYPATVLFNSAMLLKKNGKAYVQIAVKFTDLDNTRRMGKEIKIKYQLLFYRFIEAINKSENKNYRFKLTMDRSSYFAIIERLN